MDWNQGYTSTWKLYSVDQSTWGDGEEIDGLVSATITKDLDSSLMEDANITIDGNPVNGYIRLVLEAVTNTGASRTPVGTFLVTSPKRSINGSLVSVDLEAYSVLKPAADKLLSAGWYFPKGGDPVAGACELLASVLQCPVDFVESDIKTDTVKVAESNETVLSMALYLLYKTNWFIKIDGNGRVTLSEKSDRINTVFDTYSNDVLFPELSDESDIFSIPNVLKVSDGAGNYEIVRNEDDNSETSIQNIGWEKWQEESVSLDVDQTLLGEATKIMEELSKSTRKISYTREFNPEVNLNDVALYLLPQQGIVGAFRIISQSITTGAGATVEEIATFETNNWKA